MLVRLLAKSRLDKPGLCKSLDVTRKFPCKSVYAFRSETVVFMQYLYVLCSLYKSLTFNSTIIAFPNYTNISPFD
jgi:hypothetical protein